MSSRGLYDRSGEVFGYLDGTRVFDLDSRQIGELRGRVIYDLEDERRWLVDGDALLDLRGNVIGYLGEPAPRDEDW